MEPQSPGQRLTLMEERQLLARVRTGDRQSRDRIILANVGLVKKLANRYTHCGVPWNDLVQEGYLGLMHALDRFQPQGDTRLATYATWWVRYRMRRAVATQGFPLQFPTAAFMAACACGRESGESPSKTGAPTIDSGRRPMEQETSVSQIRTLGKVGGSSFMHCLTAENLADGSQPTPLEHLVATSFRHDLSRWLDRLDLRSARVIRLRYGLDGREPRSLEEIGKKLRLSGERIRQIVAEALRKLRSFL